MDLGNKLKELRKQNKLTQKQIADYIGVGQTTYSRYEELKTYPDIFVIKKLAELYKITIDQLVSNIDKNDLNFETDYINVIKKIRTQKHMTQKQKL